MGKFFQVVCLHALCNRCKRLFVATNYNIDIFHFVRFTFLSFMPVILLKTEPFIKKEISHLMKYVCYEYCILARYFVFLYIRMASINFSLDRVKFGVPLEQVCKNDIPGPLLVLILKLNKEGPTKKDVFRAPGHQGSMKKLIHFLQNGRLVNIGILHYFFVHNEEISIS